MYCIRCGTRLAKDAVFCHSCGTKVVSPMAETGVSDADRTSEDPGSDSAGQSAASVVPGAHGGEPAPQALDRADKDVATPRGETLWSSPNLISARVVAVLAKGTRLTVVERGPAGMVKVVTEDGLQGWLGTPSLSGRLVAPDGLPGPQGNQEPRAPVDRAASTRAAAAPSVPQTGDGTLAGELARHAPERANKDIASPSRETLWTAYRDAILWSSPNLMTAHLVAVLDKGIRLTVVERGPRGMARVVTEDGLEGWFTPPPGDQAARASVGNAPSARADAAPSVSQAGEGLLGRILFLLGGIGMTVSPFLPWISATFIFSVNASLYDAARMMEDYSGFAEVMVIASITLVGAFLRIIGAINLGAARVWGAIGGAAGLIEVSYRYMKFRDLFGSGFGLASLEFGFYLLGAGSIAVLVGILVDRERAQA